MKFSFRTGGVTTPIQYFSSQRGNVVALNKVGEKPTRSSQVKPQCPGAQQGGRRTPRDPPRSSTPTSFQGHCFLINRKNSKMDAY